MTSFQKIGAFIAVILLIIGVHALGWFSPFETIWTELTTAEHRIGFEVGLRLRQALKRDQIDELREENARLESDLNTLIIENARLKSSIETNEELQEQLKFLSSRELESVPARVLGRQRSGSLTTLLLDKGANDNIQKGQAVIAGEGILVGTITETSPTTSQLLLVTSSSSKLAVRFQNDPATPGVLEGQRDLSAEVRLIPQGESIEPNTTILTSGNTEHIPEGLVAGITESISEEESDLFQSARVRLLLDLSRLSIVSIVLL